MLMHTAPPGAVQDLFVLENRLSKLYDELEAFDTSPFAASTSTAPSPAVSLLESFWRNHRSTATLRGLGTLAGEAGHVRRLLDGREAASVSMDCVGPVFLPRSRPIQSLTSLLCLVRLAPPSCLSTKPPSAVAVS